MTGAGRLEGWGRVGGKGKEGSFGKSGRLIAASKVFLSPGVASQDHPPKQTEVAEKDRPVE